MKKLIFMLITAFFILNGCTKDKIIGTWVQPIPGMENQIQGFTLNKDGSAASVNMHTLSYTNWKQKENTLVLIGQSIGNGQTITIKEEFEILQIDNQTLKLRFGDTSFEYTRLTNTGE